MTADMPARLTRVPSVLADTPAAVGGWVPTVPPPLPEVVADMAAAFSLDHEAADWRTHAAWARTQRKLIAAAKRARGKRVAALRAQYAGSS